MDSTPFQLLDAHLIGQGLHRFCYQHPADPTRCIKVSLDNSARSLQEITRELRFYRFLEKVDAQDRAHLNRILPRYHGRVETTRGEGHVFDLVLDANGSISKPLSHYLQDEQLMARYGDRIRSAYQEFKTVALTGNLITMALKPYNILLQEKGDNAYQLVLVDSLGTANLIPIVYLSRCLARAKTRRHLTRFEQGLQEHYGFVIAPTGSTADDRYQDAPQGSNRTL